GLGSGARGLGEEHPARPGGPPRRRRPGHPLPRLRRGFLDHRDYPRGRRRRHDLPPPHRLSDEPAASRGDPEGGGRAAGRVARARRRPRAERPRVPGPGPALVRARPGPTTGFRRFRPPPREIQGRLDRTHAALRQAGFDGLLAFASFLAKDGHVCYLTNHKITNAPWSFNGRNNGFGFAAVVLPVGGVPILLPGTRF